LPSEAFGRLAYAAYDIVGVLALAAAIPLTPLWLWLGYGTGLAERLGIGLRARARALPRPPVWIHAASVGEVRAAGPLVAELRRRRPEVPVVMSTTTVTGRTVALSDVAPDVATLLPLDPLGFIDRALRVLRPRCVIVIETEIWPGLFRAAGCQRIPLMVASGRVSPKSAARYRWLAPLIRQALGCVATFGMQTAADAERIVSLGARSQRVGVTGSLKASVAAGDETAVPPLDGLATRRLLVAASTQPGEEQFVLDACAALWKSHPDALLLLAPRRPERFDEAAASARKVGAPTERRTTISTRIDPSTRIIVLDTVGELIRYLPFATAVFGGGTVAPLGGHNVLEPATFGKPVSFGPHTEGVAEAAAALLAADGAVRVRAPQELAAQLADCLEHPASARVMGARAQSVVAAGRAALDRTWTLLEPYLENA
jgi:3-deoxy-D-manno-octulosonic-acid transferase